MKRIAQMLSVASVLLAVAVAQPAPTPAAPYTKATLAQALEIIGGARREIYLLAPTLRSADVARALRSRAEAGVALRLLIANKAGYTGFETKLARAANVDARWLHERVNGAMLLVDDAAMVTGSVVSGLSSSGQSVAITRPELVPAMGATIKQLFARARRVR